MALARIEVLEGRPQEHRRALVRALHATLTEVLALDAERLTLRLVEHPREGVAVPGGHSDLFTAVAVSTHAVVDPRAEDRLREAIVRAAEACGIPREEVVVALAPACTEDWRVVPEAPREEETP